MFWKQGRLSKSKVSNYKSLDWIGVSVSCHSHSSTLVNDYTSVITLEKSDIWEGNSSICQCMRAGEKLYFMHFKPELHILQTSLLSCKIDVFFCVSEFYGIAYNQLFSWMDWDISIKCDIKDISKFKVKWRWHHRGTASSLAELTCFLTL